MSLWQLKKLSTGEALNNPQPLPENWGPIFGMNGFKDRLSDLSWLGEPYVDQGWVYIGEQQLSNATVEDVEETIAKRLLDTAWAVAVDNTNMTKGERAAWLEFRQTLREIPQQSGYPSNIIWPNEPV